MLLSSEFSEQKTAGVKNVLNEIGEIFHILQTSFQEAEVAPEN